MGLASREKGKRGERILVKELQSLGFTHARRGQQVNGATSADLVDVAPGLRVECKHGALVPKSPYDYLAKLTAECAPDEFPVVCMHRTEKHNGGSTAPWLAMVPVRHFTAVSKRWLTALGYTITRKDS